MGVTVRQKAKGKGQPWWVFVAHNGKRKSVCVGKKGAAEAVGEKIEAKLKLGQFNFEPEKKSKPKPIFKEYSQRWIEKVVPATCKGSTLSDYQDMLRKHVDPVFSDMKIEEITRGDIKEFLLTKTARGYAKSTAVHMKNVISGIMNLAIDHEVIKANPAHNLGRNFLAEKQKGKHVKPLTGEELKSLLDAVQEHFPEHYTLFLLLARTGVRIGEALALKWDDIDFENRSLTIQRNWVRGTIGTPKNHKSRLVDMSLQLMDVLKQHPFRGEFVFTNPKGELWNTHVWRRDVFWKALDKARMDRIGIKTLRHTYATLRISKGDNIQDVSNQLGHHSVKLTLDVYAHWMPGKKKSEVDGLDDPTPEISPAPYTHPATSPNEKWTTENPVIH